MTDDVTAALDRLIEAATVDRKWRELARITQRGRAEVAAAFQAQGRVFLRAFAEMRPRFVESVGGASYWTMFDAAGYPHPVREASPIPDDVWHRAWSDISAEMLRLMLASVVNLNELGLVLGAGALAAMMGEDIAQAFSLRNPRAVAYLEQHGAALVTKINETTRDEMRVLVRQAVDEGWSYTRTAKAIREQFEGFAGLKPQHHIRDRATLVAVTEAGQAYEEGSRIVAVGMAERGIPIEKYWRTSGDDRVSAGCRDNQAAGWLPVAEMFPSGHDRPLRFPGCRCTAQYRRAR